jgi:hypothetical protein
MSRIRDHVIFMFYGEVAIHCGDHMRYYAVAAKLGRPELDRHFDPLKAVSSKQQGKRVDDAVAEAKVLVGRRLDDLTQQIVLGPGQEFDLGDELGPHPTDAA